MTPLPRYRFDNFVLSPRQRMVWRGGAPLALIPKYFDLLLLLIRRRHEAVSKEAIFADVWTDVIVSDGALSQAVRILRRTLDDDAREPRFIRTVPRHGYQFVWVHVDEEADEGPPHVAVAGPERDTGEPSGIPEPIAPVAGEPGLDDVARLADRLMRLSTGGAASRDEARDVAERLHGLGTSTALTTLASKPGHAQALALMRDARWNVPGAGPVPLPPTAEGAAAAAALISMRLSDMRRTVARRWAGAAGAGALGGALAGLVGGSALLLAPASRTQPEALLALAAVGGVAGGVGAAGAGAGIAAAEVLARSRRHLWLTVCGGVGGAAVGALAYVLFRAIINTFVGQRAWPEGGALEGLLIGAAAGLYYGLTTPQPAGGGVAAPRGWRRLRVMALVGGGCALAALALGLLGRSLVGGHVHAVAQSSRDGQLLLGPLGRLIGEPEFGPLTRTILGAFEGGVFGASLAWGLTRRPPVPNDQNG